MTDDDVEPLAVTSNVKIVGEYDDTSGISVLGQNNASTGNPIGVKGVVPNTDLGYGLETPNDAKVGGTLQTSVLRFADTDNDFNVFTFTEETEGHLELKHGGTPTHEFTTGGDTNMTGELTENASL